MSAIMLPFVYHLIPQASLIQDVNLRVSPSIWARQDLPRPTHISTLLQVRSHRDPDTLHWVNECPVIHDDSRQWSPYRVGAVMVTSKRHCNSRPLTFQLPSPSYGRHPSDLHAYPLNPEELNSARPILQEKRRLAP
ncbi:hypothetical protein ACRALDRAFT_212406 [Sodiomyces alcalophilus JCM 7366]|uniref:uncharacterized protein n=1 Tax=Sodiomyces alcalophilus JCM 7366 TaxID=591952 RepID=UPI0039B69C04